MCGMCGTALSTQGWDGPPGWAAAFRDDVRDCTKYTGMGWAAAFRDDVLDCIELKQRNMQGSPRQTHRPMGWDCVRPPYYLHHPLNT